MLKSLYFLCISYWIRSFTSQVFKQLNKLREFWSINTTKEEQFTDDPSCQPTVGTTQVLTAFWWHMVHRAFQVSNKNYQRSAISNCSSRQCFWRFVNNRCSCSVENRYLRHFPRFFFIIAQYNQRDYRRLLSIGKTNNTYRRLFLSVSSFVKIQKLRRYVFSF